MATISLTMLSMSYSDAQGDVHDASVWLPAELVFDIVDGVGGIDWRGWGSKEAFLASKEQCGQHHVNVDKAAFAAGSMQPPQGATQAQNIALLAVGLSMAIADTPQTNADGSPKLDAQGQPVLASFFAGATQVIVNVAAGE